MWKKGRLMQRDQCADEARRNGRLTQRDVKLRPSLRDTLKRRD